jgi:hypothetical protein
LLVQHFDFSFDNLIVLLLICFHQTFTVHQRRGGNRA